MKRTFLSKTPGISVCITFILCSLMMVFAACDFKSGLSSGSDRYEIYVPFGTTQIAKNLYADICETSNTDYLEFMYWMERVYGMESPEYQKITPDTSIWIIQELQEYLPENYLGNPKFLEHPLVGITLEQAQLYSAWRTDRVVEMHLLGKKWIRPNYRPNRDNHFTIERYATGQYRNTNKLNDVLLPIFTVPALKEWLKIAGVSPVSVYGVDSLDQHNRNILEKSGFLFNTNERVTSDISRDKGDKKPGKKKVFMTQPVCEGVKNNYGLYNIIGNVSELVAQPGLCIDGNWLHEIGSIQKKETLRMNIPNCWTGFRNVCTFQLIKIVKNGEEVRT